MGWAKYYEDNISIYNNRLALIEQFTPDVQQCYEIKRPTMLNQQVLVAVSHNKNSRFGIMLSFGTAIDSSVTKKLQMNGWWFSKANNCWCQYNNQTNRQYAQQLSRSMTVKIIFAA